MVLSRATGVAMRIPVPRFLRRLVLGALAWSLRMDLTEAADPISAYRSASELFTRRLREGVRSWPSSGVAASPVDGVVGRSGRIEEGRALQAKGRWYTVSELLDDVRMAERFADGSFLTIYLSPRHYHRIHAPVSGRVTRARHVPGRLLPVNAPAVRLVDRLFPRNERLVTYVDGAVAADTPGAGNGAGKGADAGAAAGTVAVVAVGAFNVGRITAAFDETLVTNRRGARAETRLYQPAVAVERGEELMTFHLGSTVVLLFEAGVELEPLEPGSPVLLGAPITR